MGTSVEDTILFALLRHKLSKTVSTAPFLDQVRFCSMVSTAVEEMGQRLDQACKNFPEYTLHDRSHALRVVHIMAQMLDDSSRDALTPLDIALLILSAYGHDTGMAIPEARLKELKTSREYERFLADHDVLVRARDEAAAKGDWEATSKADAALQRDFLRAHHHEVSRRLMQLERAKGGFKELLIYDGTSLAVPVGMLCWSHGVSLDSILRERILHFPFEASVDADLVFLACILRLADYLEMDPGRAPEGLMKFIDVGDPISRREWLKHQASTFSVTPTEIRIAAKFDDFDAEHAYRQTIKGLDTERQEIMSYLSSRPNCMVPPRLQLYTRIDTTPIESDGYIYREFRFRLEYGQILKLLMGTRLYRDERVFVRELIQNALDASRHAAAAEEAKTKSPPRTRFIEVRRAASDALEIEVEDQGSGMTLSIIERYFMRVGQSFYQSPEFRHAKMHFRPVSQFGIGILSCFMKADNVEVETRADPYVHAEIDEDTREGVKLEIRGLYKFFVLSKQPRDVPGTLVRVKLRHPLTESLESLVTMYLARCPFEVRIKDGDRTVKLVAPDWSVEGDRFAGMFLQTPDAFGYTSRTLEFEGPFGFGTKGSIRFFILQRGGRAALRLTDAGPYKVVSFSETGETVINLTSFDESANKKYQEIVGKIRGSADDISMQLRPLVDAFVGYTRELVTSLTKREAGNRVEALWDAIKSQVKLISTQPAAKGHPGLSRLRERLDDVIQHLESFMTGELRKWPPIGVCTQDGIELTSQADLPGLLKLGIPFVYNLDFAGEYRFSLNVARDGVIPDTQSETVLMFLRKRVGAFLGEWFGTEGVPAVQVKEYCERAHPVLATEADTAFRASNKSLPSNA